MILHEYFHSLLGPSSSRHTPIDPQIILLDNTLPVGLQLKMCSSFTDNDIKQAIFSIPNLKSSGPDGFSNDFFQINLVYYWTPGLQCCTTFFPDLTASPISWAYKASPNPQGP